MATARVLTGIVTLMLLAGAGYGSADDEDTPLRPAAGPYRGIVVDEKTGQPLPSAAVVILWQRLDDQIQGLRRLVGAQEVFTNEKGEFVHDVASVETRLPPRTFAPRIMIFRPGYAPLPDRPQLFPPGVAASRFIGQGAQHPDERVEGFRPILVVRDRRQAYLSSLADEAASRDPGREELRPIG